MTLRERLEELERAILTDALERHDGHQTKVINELKVSRSNLYLKIKKYGLESLLKANIITPKGSNRPAIERAASAPSSVRPQDLEPLARGIRA